MLHFLQNIFDNPNGFTLFDFMSLFSAFLHFVPSIQGGQQTKEDKLVAEKCHQLCMIVCLPPAHVTHMSHIMHVR